MIVRLEIISFFMCYCEIYLMADIKRYQLKCKNCSYYWDTKYAKIPARCPSCGGKIFGTYNYEVLKEYKEGCFIATAAYDNPFTRDINILRLWRDSSLSKSSLGRNSVSIYYTVSPPIAEKVNKKAFLKKLIRMSLKPLIFLLKIKFNCY